MKVNYAMSMTTQYYTEGLKKKPENGGFDLYAVIDESITLGPLERALIPTGIFLDPELMGLHSDIRPTSGLPWKHGVVAMLGLIDWGYRGELKATLINMSNEPFTIVPNSKIGQLVFWQEVDVELIQVSKDELTPSDRGAKGFGEQSGIT